MTGEQLLYAGIAALGVLQVAMLAWLLARAGRAAGDGGRRDGDTVAPIERPAGADTVACPRCETVNERGYRFCQACVAELPGADGRTGWVPAPQRGSVP
jgi:hypothetical protein